MAIHNHGSIRQALHSLTVYDSLLASRIGSTSVLFHIVIIIIWQTLFVKYSHLFKISGKKTSSGDDVESGSSEDEQEKPSSQAEDEEEISAEGPAAQSEDSDWC